ncbi:MAG TPA: MBL fold metallo-hydrolase [Terriglobales bacterium]|jgi:L-ascorbate 6-phosphate lactonase|nr:MBL fold metallo-hydrolase [Terriglobales bacterium]
MASVAETIRDRKVARGQLAIYWLCQAGFAFKSASGEVVYIDPYFSDVVERIVGFKRMMTCPVPAEDANADLLVCTHEHLDHMDTDALPILAKNPKTKFAGPIECIKEFEKLGISSSRCHLLEEGKSITIGSVKLNAVYADHGELAPDALGLVLDFEGIKVYHTGDTAYRPKEFKPAIDMRSDILIPCINGVFGNMDAHEAAQMTGLVAPAVVIPSHFWMFVEQNGNPGTFLEECKTTAPNTRTVLTKPGEEFLFEKA